MPPKIRELTGQRFGRLQVIERAENSKTGKPMWKCICDCGTECVVHGSALVGGYTKSCGCYRREIPKTTRYVHGGCSRRTRDRLYAVWNMMKQRCNDPNNRAYSSYGGRGIKVCDEWNGSYAAFREWAYANGYDENSTHRDCTIDRIDNDKGYSPENCRIANAKTQANNTRKTRYITYKGETKPFTVWAEEAGLKVATLRNRLKGGWQLEDALTIKAVIGANQNVKRNRTHN